jgi:hydroxyacylglutathione hydrolase
MPFLIFAISAFSDNYIWMFHLPDKKGACVVDPGESTPVLRALDEHGLHLETILVTHHHADHTGGISALLQAYPNTRVYGPESAHIACNNTLRGQERFELMGYQVEVLAVPGHTLDHLAYYLPSAETGQANVLFCGDTLFAGGCGRIFEGTPALMLRSLKNLASLPEDTQVYCAHEYTLANLVFANVVEPGNIALAGRMDAVRALRSTGTLTLPSTIAMELRTNPFLRCHKLAIMAKISEHFADVSIDNELDAFTKLRAWKDVFKA